MAAADYQAQTMGIFTPVLGGSELHNEIRLTFSKRNLRHGGFIPEVAATQLSVILAYCRFVSWNCGILNLGPFQVSIIVIVMAGTLWIP